MLLGVNHKTTPLEIREKIALSSGYEEPLARLRKLREVVECCLLSTCNRVEVLFTTTGPDAARGAVLDFLFGAVVDPGRREAYVYTHCGEAAVKHVFKVASSLDSMIIGESQILGQLKEAYRHATTIETTGTILNKLLHKSFSVAKRVRTETKIGASAVSISYAAVELARKIFGHLDGKSVLLIGAGEMAELAAEHLVAQGVGEVVVANRTLERAVRLSRRWEGRAVSMDEILDQLARVDIVISSTGATGLILTSDQVKPVMRQRRNRPLFLIDIAVPRDLDHGINEIENVYLYDIDDLSQVVELNKSDREQEAIKARRIVDEETIKFAEWLANMELTPTIVGLRSQAESIRKAEIERTLGRLGDLDPSERKAIEAMAAAIVSKMLYHPIQFLKSDHGQPQQEKLGLVRAIYRLDEAGGGGRDE